MKHRKVFFAFTALAVTGAFAPASAQGIDLTRYGRIDLTVESNTNGNLNRSLIQNFSWRLGVREERKFSTDLSGVFQIEIGVAPDDHLRIRGIRQAGQHPARDLCPG